MFLLLAEKLAALGNRVIKGHHAVNMVDEFIILSFLW